MDDILSKEQKIELVMEQFEILYRQAAKEAGWVDIPKNVHLALDEAYRLLDQFISDSKASPKGTRGYRQLPAE